MAFDDQRQSPVIDYGSDFLLYNPFSIEEGGEIILERDVSGVGRLVGTGTSGNARHIRHTRSRTEDNPTGYGGYLHPLRSAGLAIESSNAGVTRPHLSRIVDMVDTPIEGDDVEHVLSQVEEKDVLVHEIKSNDSLAGVSLKYGISMAELRRSNHLWASDTIHMRKVLYIPIEKVSRAQNPPANEILVSVTPAEEVLDPAPEDSSVITSSTMGTIHRIPASRLSFFPPSSNAASDSSRSASSSDRFVATPAGRSFITHNRQTASPSPSLTSLLSALPIAASTRDTIIARLSFDSASPNYSDQEELGGHYDGLELDDVQHAGSNHASFRLSTNVNTPARPITFQKTNYKTPRIDDSAIKLHYHNTPNHVRTLSSSPHSYIPPHPQIRNVQLEPSPEMHLPPSSSLWVAKRSRAIPPDFESRGVLQPQMP